MISLREIFDFIEQNAKTIIICFTFWYIFWTAIFFGTEINSYIVGLVFTLIFTPISLFIVLGLSDFLRGLWYAINEGDGL